MSDLIRITRIASPHEEQDWNRQQLAAPVQAARFRFWTYDAPGVVLGCSQVGLISLVNAAQKAGLPLAGRQAGGGVVLVGPWMLSVSVLLPVDHPLAAGGALAGYRRLGDAFAGSLRTLGVDARALPPEHVRPGGAAAAQEGPDWACYGGLSPWEVVVGRRKLVGLAQVRRRTGVLLTAGLLLAPPDWRLLCEAIGKPEQDARDLSRCTTSCLAELGWQPTIDEIVFSLRQRLLDVLEPEPCAAGQSEPSPRAAEARVPIPLS